MSKKNRRKGFVNIEIEQFKKLFDWNYNVKLFTLKENGLISLNVIYYQGRGGDSVHQCCFLIHSLPEDEIRSWGWVLELADELHLGVGLEHLFSSSQNLGIALWTIYDLFNLFYLPWKSNFPMTPYVRQLVGYTSGALLTLSQYLIWITQSRK